MCTVATLIISPFAKRHSFFLPIYDNLLSINLNLLGKFMTFFPKSHDCHMTSDSSFRFLFSLLPVDVHSLFS